MTRAKGYTFLKVGVVSLLLAVVVFFIGLRSTAFGEIPTTPNGALAVISLTGILATVGCVAMIIGLSILVRRK